ncbi:MAG: glycolate oxidase subunit GlcE [SAR324 cluster bacterium]|nr:glycolate oxidase subunit GlcE [SAR324 cluster bacterium]
MNPTEPAEIQDILAQAKARKQPLEVVGGGSKRFFGRPGEGAETLSLAEMRGIVDYQPGELICVVRPGTPMAELEGVLAEYGQTLAFEPPHWGESATVGGTVACNLSGPRRFKAGAARDHLLGFQAVTGRGDIIRGGGRVVKNVTGYDLSKLMCGSFGTLAVLTELCLKVLPRGETEHTVAIRGHSAREGVAALIAAVKSPHDVSGLAYLPEDSALPAPVMETVANTGAGEGSGAATLIRVEGPEPSVIYRSGQIARLAGDNAVTILEREASREVWRAIRELEPLPLEEGEALWRFSVPPTESVPLVEELSRRTNLRPVYDWGGGLVWARLPAATDAAELHRAAEAAGGHARLVRTTRPLADGSERLPAQTGARELIHRNLKQAFDPEGILNPGKWYPDW